MTIAREGWPFAAISLVLAIAVGVLLHPAAAVPLLLFCLFVLWFFRDPERTPPDASNALLCPADGTIIQAGPETISVFMNVFNVHIIRAPVAGGVASVEHKPGKFLAAFKTAAATQNERTKIVLEANGHRVVFTLIAGLIARRIVCKVVPGQQMRAGERVGLIRFGSRVDIELPADYLAAVEIGQKVVAGETILAKRPPSAAPRDML
jgi:phosphatidylserine decarboxylase